VAFKSVSRGKRAILFVLLGLACLTTGELLARNHFTVEQNKIISQSPDRSQYLKAAADPLLIYSYQPNVWGFNSQGFYDHEYSYEKRPGVSRIVVIGDSTADARYVKFGESYSKVLERLLNQGFTERKYEVIVIARGGYSTGQELTLLKKEAFKYKPDVILWSYCLNDPGHPIFHDQSGHEAHDVYRPRVFLYHYLEMGLFNLWERIKGRHCDAQYLNFIHCVYWDQVVRQVTEIGKVSRQQNVPVVFMIFPAFVQGKPFDQYPFAKTHQQLSDLAQSQGLLAIDLLKIFQAYDISQVSLKEGEEAISLHPNALGHAVVGEFLTTWLFKEKLLPE
jgi:lysophospholipase L1-like esterase